MTDANPPPGLNRGYNQSSELRVGGGPARLSTYFVARFGTGTYNFGGALLRTGP